MGALNYMLSLFAAIADPMTSRVDSDSRLVADSLPAVAVAVGSAGSRLAAVALAAVPDSAAALAAGCFRL